MRIALRFLQFLPEIIKAVVATTAWLKEVRKRKLEDETDNQDNNQTKL